MTPISKKSLLNFIQEFYNQKIMNNQEKNLKEKPIIQVDTFFFNFMNDKFPIKKVFSENLEALIKSVLKYSSKC